nr:ABC transporter substrate-binding protein [Parafrankia sp. EUN1f]
MTLEARSARSVLVRPAHAALLRSAAVRSAAVRSAAVRTVVVRTVVVGSATMLVATCGSRPAGGPPALRWYVYNESSGSFAAAAADCSASSGGAYRISIDVLPNDADGQRQQLVRRLAAEDTSMDILALDVTWTPEFAEAGWIEAFDDATAQRITTGTLPVATRTGTWANHLYAAPLNTNVQLLWYRKDLVPTPPRTWDEMLAAARGLAARGRPHLVEVQGAQYEGLTVLFNTLVASAGGSILSADGSRVRLGAPAEQAVAAIRALADSPAADPSWSNQREDDNRLVFESGAAAFQLNYPFVYPSARHNAPGLAPEIGWAQWPGLVAGQPSHPTIGGYNLAVSSYSAHPDLARRAIECLRGRANQIRTAIRGGLAPTLEALYTDRELIDGGYPFAAAVGEALRNASVRPRTPAYQTVSLQISDALSPPRSASVGRLDGLRTAIADALESKGLVP